MLNLNPDVVQRIIELAREFHAKEEVVFPEQAGSYTEDWALQVLADHADDESLRELKYLIDNLDMDQQISLVALMWLGRGDFGVVEWSAAMLEATRCWNTRTSEYLIGTPLVADYLEEGLQQLNIFC